MQQAHGLAGLSDEAFGAVVNGVIPSAYGAEVGRQISDPAQQKAAIQILHRADPPNVEQARLLVQDVKNSGFLQGAGQDDLFEHDAFAQSLFPERARVLGQAIQTLRSNKRVFKAAVEGEDALSGAGNQMDTAANQKGQTENEQLIDTLQRDAITRGPLSDLLTEQARAVANGKQVRGAAADFIARAKGLIRSGKDQGVGYRPADNRAEPPLDGGSEVGPVEGQGGFFSNRGTNSTPELDKPVHDPVIQAAAEHVMRLSGLPKTVALKLFEKIRGGTADGSYAAGVIRLALDTPAHELPAKFFHEIVHALRDPDLGLLKPGERVALDRAAVKYLRQGTNKADIEKLYPGADAQTVHEEAIARLAERALNKAGSQPPFITRLAHRMVNFVRSLGQALRGQGFTTADDVFRSIMSGRRSGERVAEPEGARGAAAASVEDEAQRVAANTPETYFARRPLITDKAGLERAGQGALFGRSAVQAQAARDAAGNLKAEVPQKAADEGLFAPRTAPQPELPVAHGQPARDAAAEVVRWGKANNREALRFYDPTSDQITHQSVGTVSGVDFTPEMLRDVRDPARTLVALHNHPGSTALSKADLAQLAKPGMSHVVEHGHDGTMSAASAPPEFKAAAKGGNPLSENDISEAVHRIVQQHNRVSAKLEGPLVSVVRGGAATVTQYKRYYWDAVNRVLDYGGVIHYLSSHSQPPALGRVLGPIARELFGNRGKDANDRILNTVSADEGLDRVIAQARSEADQKLHRSGGDQPASSVHKETQSRSVPWRPPVTKGEQGRLFSLRDDPTDQGRLALPPGPLMTKTVPLTLEAPPLPAASRTQLRAAFDAIKERAANGAREARESLFPLTAGTKEAQTVAFKFANALRGIQYRYGKLDTMVTARFTPAERTAMGRALDAQSVFEQQLRDNLKQLPVEEHAQHEQEARTAFDESGQGLAGLTDKQRATVEALNTLSKATWQRMAARGIVRPGSDGLPYYMPRQFVMVDATRTARRIGPKDRAPDLAGPQADGGTGGRAGK